VCQRFDFASVHTLVFIGKTRENTVVFRDARKTPEMKENGGFRKPKRHAASCNSDRPRAALTAVAKEHSCTHLEIYGKKDCNAARRLIIFESIG
jgi:hypothetical protein